MNCRESRFIDKSFRTRVLHVGSGVMVAWHKLYVQCELYGVSVDRYVVANACCTLMLLNNWIWKNPGTCCISILNENSTPKGRKRYTIFLAWLWTGLKIFWRGLYDTLKRLCPPVGSVATGWVYPKVIWILVCFSGSGLACKSGMSHTFPTNMSAVFKKNCIYCSI